MNQEDDQIIVIEHTERIKQLQMFLAYVFRREQDRSANCLLLELLSTIKGRGEHSQSFEKERTKPSKKFTSQGANVHFEHVA